MTPDELRSEVLKHQTACRCGHLLAACADCNGWLVEHSPRIAGAWRWYFLSYVGTSHLPAGIRGADLAEDDDRAFYGL